MVVAKADGNTVLVGLLEHPATSLDEHLGAGGGRGLERALSLPRGRVVEEVALSGLRGRGGAGFPTGRKWLAVASTGTGERFVVCNAAEGEPAAFKDRYLIRHNPYRLIDGISIAAYAVGANRAYLALKDVFREEAETLAGALQEFQEAGALPVPIELVLGPDHYLLGEETGLLEAIEERAPLPRVARPYMFGLFARPPDENPTLVNNVETLSNVPYILAEGPDWLRAEGTDASPGTMLFTVAGDVEREGVYERPLGTSLGEVIASAAGGVRGGGSLKVVFPGASNTALVPEQLETPLAFESMAAVGSGLGAGGFAVYDDTTCIVEVALLFCRFLHVESCAQCPPCKLNSGDVVEFLDGLERGRAGGDLDVALARARAATDGQKCGLPTGTSLLMQSLMLLFTDEFRAHRGRACPSPRALVLPKIVDLDEEQGRFRYDERYGAKRPDWTYGSTDGDAGSFATS
ncbi:MAG TPA: NADH-ubiquinone oxidoreductase-F iron-sulfur binding region domain-containing protein [Actinomycetota bacterium]|nr:NADH-ubiquinone oxidoreductase-F iron-sulfur binding region domain-containing protein [Actinomycetota bacterium]